MTATVAVRMAAPDEVVDDGVPSDEPKLPLYPPPPCLISEEESLASDPPPERSERAVGGRRRWRRWNPAIGRRT